MSYLQQQQQRSSNGRSTVPAGRSDKDKEKYLMQEALASLLREEDNKYCADCEAKSPRWASWNIGVFICIRCAGIHRKLGVHISKVKSVNLDSWTLDQVAGVAAMGNTLARAAYEANLPNGFRRPNSDAGMEQFIKAKYEDRRYLIANFKPPRPDPASVYSLVKSGGQANTQAASQRVSALPRPPIPPPSATGGGALQPVTHQQQQQQQPAPPQPQPPQDLLLIGVEDLTSAPSVGSIGKHGPGSPDSDFGCFTAAPTVANNGNQQQQPRVNPDLIFGNDGVDGGGVGGWPTGSDAAAAPVPKVSAKDSIMALYGRQQQQLALPSGGMHYSASSPMLTMGQPAMYQQQQQQQHQFYQQQMMQSQGLYSQTAGTLLYSSGQQQQQPQQQQYFHGSSQQQHQIFNPTPPNQAAYLQQIQSQMSSMSFGGMQQHQQQQQQSGGFPTDIWN